MNPYLIGGLFGAAFLAAAWSLAVSIRPQLGRFRDLLFGEHVA